MATAKARIYLFHGNDTEASNKALKRWETLFYTKYGEATKYIIEADELSVEQFEQRLYEILQSPALFSEPQLLIVKRATTSDKGRSTAYTKVLLGALQSMQKEVDPKFTVVVWEERALSESNSIFQWFTKQQAKELALIHSYQVVQAPALLARARAQIEEAGLALDREAELWLSAAFRQIEKAQRLAKRLRANEQLAEDERSWWLSHLIELVVLQATGKVITRDALEATYRLENPVSVFEVVNLMTGERWEQLRKLLPDWQRTADEGDYFGLYALLRNQYRKFDNQYALQLLAEIEVISKNFSLQPAWLLELFMLRLEHARKGHNVPLLPPRTLWLATLPRS